MTDATGVIGLVRLTEVDLDDVRAVLDDARTARHLPLSGAPVDAAAWVAAKDASWSTHGYGPWAVLVDGTVVGWGGFLPEDDGPDLALVLVPGAWGIGTRVVHEMVRRGFGELGFAAVTIALPYSRNPTHAVARLGFEPAGEVTHDGIAFRRYVLRRESWDARTEA